MDHECGGLSSNGPTLTPSLARPCVCVCSVDASELDDPSSVHGRKAVIALAHAHARLITATVASRAVGDAAGGAAERGGREGDSGDDPLPAASPWWAQRAPQASLLSAAGAYTHGKLIGMLSAVRARGWGGWRTAPHARAGARTHMCTHVRACAHPLTHTHTPALGIAACADDTHTHSLAQGARARRVEDAFGTSRAMRGYPGVLCSLLAALCPDRDRAVWRADSAAHVIRQAAVLLWCVGARSPYMHTLPVSALLTLPTSQSSQSSLLPCFPASRNSRRLLAAPTLAEAACSSRATPNTLGRCLLAAWRGQDVHTAYALCGALRAACLARSVLEQRDHPVASCADAVSALHGVVEAGADHALDHGHTHARAHTHAHASSSGHSSKAAPLSPSDARARCTVFAAEALYSMVRVHARPVGVMQSAGADLTQSHAQVPELTAPDSLWSPGTRALLIGRLWAAHAARGREIELLRLVVQLRRSMASPSGHAASPRPASPPAHASRHGKLAARLAAAQASRGEASGADRFAATAERALASSFLDVRAARSGAGGSGLWSIAMRRPQSDREEEAAQRAVRGRGVGLWHPTHALSP